MVYVITILLIVIDRVTKGWALIYLKDQDSIQVIPHVFSLNFVANKGMGFGILPSFGYIQVYLVILLLGVAGYYLWRYNLSKGNKIAVSLILAGAIGNAVDRLLYGFVVDMLEITFFSFPVFNIADVCIVGGIILLMAMILFSKKPLAKKERKE